MNEKIFFLIAFTVIIEGILILTIKLAIKTSKRTKEKIIISTRSNGTYEMRISSKQKEGTFFIFEREDEIISFLQNRYHLNTCISFDGEKLSLADLKKILLKKQQNPQT